METNLPEHIAIIMDGNGRWARERGLKRTEGHKEGLEAAKRIVRRVSDIGVPYLTLYTFSTENWRRAEQEVSFLMGLIHKHLKAEFEFYKQHKIRVVHSGDLSGLPYVIQDDIHDVMNTTSHFTKLTLNLAINYGGRDEIVRAVKRIVEHHGHVNEESIAAALDQPFLPEPDLIIRTGGEQRISNFLIWQSAYAELMFTEKYWPDIIPEDIDQMIEAFSSRTRRFGAVHE
jgi:undecaprenyl diphosphate synthase